jgi:hypothetical protein
VTKRRSGWRVDLLFVTDYPPRRGSGVTGYIACETLDMLKSGTRRAGIAVREK